MNFLVRRAGFFTTVQDLGRTGSRDLGMSLGGALDSHALRVANVLVGNEETAAGLELTAGRVALRFDDARVVAWCGRDFSVRLGELHIPAGHPALVLPGEELTVAAPAVLSRAWLAISGGVDVPVVLRSRSTDLQASFGGLNGRALRDGDVVPLGAAPSVAGRIAAALRGGRIATWSSRPDWIEGSEGPIILRVVRGADWCRFAPEIRAELTRAPFTVLPESNRMGARLQGPELRRTDSDDMLSEGVTPGTLQVPPDGNPILLLNDCQTIGGYPKIAHVITVDQNAAARLRPGDVVRFHEVEMEKARTLRRKREEDFTRFRAGVAARFS